MNILKKTTALLLTAATALTAAGCSAPAETDGGSLIPLVVGTSEFSRKFSPFFAENATDTSIVNLVCPPLMTMDRQGGIVYNAIAGETASYNGTEYTYTGPADISVRENEADGTTVYTVKIRDDIRFSDGTYMTADDIIFTYYVLADPSYTGSSTLYSVPIKGMESYRTQIPQAALEKYGVLADEIYAAGRNGEGDSFTAVQQELYWRCVDEAVKAELQEIIDKVSAEYLTDEYAQVIGATADEISASDELKLVFAMAMWGFGEAAEGVFSFADGTEYNFGGGVYPTLDDAAKSVLVQYDGDLIAFSDAESAGTINAYADARVMFIEALSEAESGEAGAVESIEGIRKISDTEVEITTDGYTAAAIYQIGGISVAPLAYYGDKELFDYEKNSFGFERGNLSSVEAKTQKPMGWGPYKFVKYENKIVYMEANEFYYSGEAQTKLLQFRETQETDKISGVGQGTIDLSEPAASLEGLEEIRSYNSNGELSGDKLATSQTDYLGYGFIGINSATVNVAGEPDSAASKSLRKAIATILAVYRELTVNSYYGDTAKVIDYPISATSWAAPQKTDPDYRTAYSVDAAGNNIFTAGMSDSERIEAAKTAALSFFEAAGYTVEGGKLVSAPDGAKLGYEIFIAGGGSGDHPTFALVTAAKEALSELGLTLTVNDPADPNAMWNSVHANTHELWCAAWQATVDPDMYQVYHSTNTVGGGGTGSNHYNIADAKLDRYITEARESSDAAYRKELYKQCLDVILDWAVEIPVYQRMNTVVYSAQRIDSSTMTADMTPYWGWAAEIDKIKMK